ncbi:hypothetical protein [Gilliamella sp. Pas-s25]|uniref:hypothetical protein n=1 Tax=Gilliamella sp. Pas-s25 TaxID=2687310 RepID=UPI00135EDBC2|nr:hypothetical protein [Gilliamella sp. Pas-s25]MWP63107.1 hypothetical protein [Gilliamella sp. Pas-s25]
MSFYLRAKKTATRLIDKFGQQVEVTRTVAIPSADEWKSDRVEIKTFNAVMIFISGGNERYFEWLNTEITEDSDIVLIPASSYVPEKNDKIKKGGKQFTIEKVKTLAPADVELLYMAVLV